jgi:hypothetical protein
VKWRKLYKEELHDLYIPLNMIKTIKSVARKVCKNLFVKHEGSEHLEDLGVDDSVILKWILDISCVDMVWIQVAQDKVQ